MPRYPETQPEGLPSSTVHDAPADQTPVTMEQVERRLFPTLQGLMKTNQDQAKEIGELRQQLAALQKPPEVPKEPEPTKPEEDPAVVLERRYRGVTESLVTKYHIPEVRNRAWWGDVVIPTFYGLTLGPVAAAFSSVGSRLFGKALWRGVSEVRNGGVSQSAAQQFVQVNVNRNKGFFPFRIIHDSFMWLPRKLHKRAVLDGDVNELNKIRSNRQQLRSLPQRKIKSLLGKAAEAEVFVKTVNAATPTDAIQWKEDEKKALERFETAASLGPELYVNYIGKMGPGETLEQLDRDINRKARWNERVRFVKGAIAQSVGSALPAAAVSLLAGVVRSASHYPYAALEDRLADIRFALSRWLHQAGDWLNQHTPSNWHVWEQQTPQPAPQTPAAPSTPAMPGAQPAPTAPSTPNSPTAGGKPPYFETYTVKPGDSVWNLEQDALNRANVRWLNEDVNALKNGDIWQNNIPAGFNGQHWLYPGDTFIRSSPLTAAEIHNALNSSYPENVHKAAMALAHPSAVTNPTNDSIIAKAWETFLGYLKMK